MMLTADLLTVLAGRGGWEHGWSGWWFGPLVPLLWLALVGLTVWLITRRRRPSEPTGIDRARQVLAERYARGELSTDDYRERLDNLH